ncbi:MAG: carboxypeptidase-like regulatory domain-containing protein [Clostridia bacterium]|nr:carboxypeptidase-like regulatory domain-containing protein [Clostridia bacterium]MDD4047855.1 carboxypeptidase-like regulatory domain-containing protein [Clostridia bacterium]
MAVVFPSNDQYVALTKDGIPFIDPVGDENPASTDIVGTVDYPAVYFATDITHAFFRFRLRGSPELSGGFTNYAWVILFDLNNNLLVDSYQWEFALNGVTEEEMLIQNTVPNSPGSGWTDSAEGTPITFPVVSYDIARAVIADSTLGGVQNYFLDLSVEISVLHSTLGIADDTPLRFTYFTAANPNNFNKDRLCGNFYVCFSDPLTLTTQLSGQITNKDTGVAIADALVEIYDGDVLVDSTTTDMLGQYVFSEPDTGFYTIKISKCCFFSNCYCNSVTVEQNKNNIYNFSLAPDCVCVIKCLMAEDERDIIDEKQRVYEKVTDYFITSIPDQETLSRYITLLCLLNKGTSVLDCCIAKVLKNLYTCEEGECDG